MDEVSQILAEARADNTRTLAALEREHARMVEASLDSNADDEHDPEGATIAFEREQLTAAIARARADRLRIDEAEADLAAGRYGVCTNCGERIAPARLEARPLAVLCISCARLTANS